ncbi:MAG: type II toxin-antitoxin system Phd/YefM family antitoxin [Deferribacteraceae bacterium]|jgi:prevent-host-death family protein|nr:type II toxin-antitoxin system Phd/YefM family antitoxin [Deferribacteraceae bacterium]
MKLSEQIKPISYLKANAAEIIRTINEIDGQYIITQNGEAKAVLIGIDTYDKMQETIALLSGTSRKTGRK